MVLVETQGWAGLQIGARVHLRLPLGFPAGQGRRVVIQIRVAPRAGTTRRYIVRVVLHAAERRLATAVASPAQIGLGGTAALGLCLPSVGMAHGRIKTGFIPDGLVMERQFARGPIEGEIAPLRLARAGAAFSQGHGRLRRLGCKIAVGFGIGEGQRQLCAFGQLGKDILLPSPPLATPARKQAEQAAECDTLPARRTGRAGRPHGRHLALDAEILDVAHALILQHPLGALDGEAVGIEQVPDAAQEVHVLRPIESPAAGALHRLDLGESAFPETQDVLRQLKLVRHLADGPEGVRSFLRLARVAHLVSRLVRPNRPEPVEES